MACTTGVDGFLIVRGVIFCLADDVTCGRLLVVFVTVERVCSSGGDDCFVTVVLLLVLLLATTGRDVRVVTFGRELVEMLGRVETRGRMVVVRVATDGLDEVRVAVLLETDGVDRLVRLLTDGLDALVGARFTTGLLLGLEALDACLLLDFS